MKRWLLCAVFFLVAAAFTCLGMFHLERAASCLPEGIIYADPNGVVQQPMEEDALDSPWIASYVKEGEWVTFLLFSSQVTTAEEAEQLVTSLLGLGAGELVLSTKDIATMLRQLKTVFWLVLIPCLLVNAYCVTVKNFPHRWKTFTVTKRVVAALFLCGVFPALFAGYVIAWQSLQIPDIFLPTEHFFDLSFYISKISWAMEGVDLGRLEWGGLPVRAWTIAGLCLLAMALVSTLAAGILFVSALGNKRDKENA